MENESWISVELKKPETIKEVLVWKEHHCDVPIQAYYFATHDSWHGSREVRDCMMDGYCQDSKLSFIPTHWMPIPQPPKS